MNVDRGSWVLTAGTVGTVAGMLPAFLMGAMTLDLAVDLGVGSSFVGVGVALFFCFSALGSYLSSGLIEKVGAPWSFLAGLLTVTTACALVLSFVNRPGALLTALVFLGFGNGVLQPAVNVWLLRRIGVAQRGLAFGIKQAAVPVATMLAALALPGVIEPHGWKAAFGVVLAVCGMALVSTLFAGGLGLEKSGVRTIARGGVGGSLLDIAIAAGFGSAAANSLGVFLIVVLMQRNGGAGLVAGALVAAGSLINIVVRVGAGRLVDMGRCRPLPTVSWLMFAGSMGCLMLVVDLPMVLTFVGVLAALGLGWGWNGLLHHGVMERFTESAASAAGRVQMSIFLGAMIGPGVIGVIIEWGSHSLALACVSGSFLVAGVLVRRGTSR